MMNLYTVLSVAVVVIGAVIGIIKAVKIKAGGEIVKAGMQAAATALSPADDTPGKITASEWGEIVEAMGKKAKEVL